ncbi:MAG: DUF1499 domain-containing protein [Pirellulaceae bacterium]
MIRKVKTRMGWIILIFVLAIFAGIFVLVDDWKRDWTTNWAETDPQAEAADLRPFHSPLPPDALQQEVLEWVFQQSRWAVGDESGEIAPSAPSGNPPIQAPLQLHLVRSTRIMQFKDDVHLTIDRDPESGGSVLHVQSRSRIGRGDLGQNPRNIKELIAGMKARRSMQPSRSPRSNGYD